MLDSLEDDVFGRHHAGRGRRAASSCGSTCRTASRVTPWPRRPWPKAWPSYPGSIFYPNGDGGSSGLRLSFSNASPERIREGIRRLKRGVAAVGRVKALLLTNEYPPNVYGGAGVHVEFLSRELARLMDVEVRCFGDQHVDDGRLRVRGYPEPGGMTRARVSATGLRRDGSRRCLGRRRTSTPTSSTATPGTATWAAS